MTLLTSSAIRYRQGTVTRVMLVANRMPKPGEIAIGIMNRAWREVSKIIGASPPNVVIVF